MITAHFSQEQDKTEDAAMTPHFSQEQDRPEELNIQRLEAEAQRLDMEFEIYMATMQENQSEEQEQDREFETEQQGQDTEFQDQQQTMSENEVKRVVTLDKTGT